MLPISFFFFNDTATTEIYTLSLHDALPISGDDDAFNDREHGLEPAVVGGVTPYHTERSEEHTSELQSLAYLVCRLLLEKKKKNKKVHTHLRKRKHHKRWTLCAIWYWHL